MQDPAFQDTATAQTFFARLATLVLRNIATEYPYHLQHLVLNSDDAATPRDLHPSFHNCFDWHSAVHSHWMLVRLLHTWPEIPQHSQMVRALDETFAPARLETEAAYLRRSSRASFERPYGLAWVLQLAAELETSGHPRAAAWHAAMAPLEMAAATNMLAWLDTLRYPVRTGGHQQTAFAWILMLAWAKASARRDVHESIRAAAVRCYGNDVRAPLDYEPSGEDFLSPCLMEADLMSRLFAAPEFGHWLERFLPQLPTDGRAHWLEPASVSDESDGRAVHLHGLNLSRAWNLARLARALPQLDSRVAGLKAAADRHAHAGLTAVRRTTHYASTHWLPTFAVYLLTSNEAS